MTVSQLIATLSRFPLHYEIEAVQERELQDDISFDLSSAELIEGTKIVALFVTPQTPRPSPPLNLR